MKKKLVSRLSLICITLLLASPSTWADVGFVSNLEIRYEDNIGLAPVSADKQSDLTTQLDVGFDWKFVSSPTGEVSLGGTAYYAYVSDLTDLSQWGIDLDFDYRGKASSDFTAFWWNLSAEGKTLKFKDSDIRDGWEAQAAAEIGKRFNNWFGLSGGARVETRRATDDNPAGQPPSWNADKVFDMDNWAAFLRAAFTVAADTEIFAKYTFRSGDVASTGRQFNNGGQFDRALDFAFGPGYVVWRIDADQNIFDAGISHTFSPKWSIEFAVGYLDAAGEANNDYDNFYTTLSGSFGF
jgi:hypothetical protein